MKIRGYNFLLVICIFTSIVAQSVRLPYKDLERAEKFLSKKALQLKWSKPDSKYFDPELDKGCAKIYEDRFMKRSSEFLEVSVIIKGSGILHYRVSKNALLLLSVPETCVVVNSLDEAVETDTMSSPPLDYFLICREDGFKMNDLRAFAAKRGTASSVTKVPLSIVPEAIVFDDFDIEKVQQAAPKSAIEKFIFDEYFASRGKPIGIVVNTAGKEEYSAYYILFSDHSQVKNLQADRVPRGYKLDFVEMEQAKDDSDVETPKTIFYAKP